MASSMTPANPPSDPHVPLSSVIKLAFLCVTKAFSRVTTALAAISNNTTQNITAQSEGSEVTPGMHSILDIPNFTGEHHMVVWWNSSASYELPTSVNAFNIQVQHPKRRVFASLARKFVGLAFQAAVSFAALSFQGSESSSSQAQDKPPFHLQYVVQVVMVIGFTACLIEMLLHNAYPVIANFSATIGVLVSALGFYMMTLTILSAYFMWITLLVGAASLLALLFAFIK